MMDYNNGKIHVWNGGECPVHSKSLVKAWHRKGKLSYDYAIHLRWNHWGDDDIIAFQVTRLHEETKTVWVNEYEDGVSAYESEDKAREYYTSDARYFANEGAIRIAVKYVEVKE